MKRLRYIQWMLLGVAASIILWACGEEDVVIDNGPHPFIFYVEDETGNDLLTERLSSEMTLVENAAIPYYYVEGRCSIFERDRAKDGEWIMIYKKSDGSNKYATNEREYAKIDPIVTYTKFRIKLFDDDTEEIVFEAKDPKVNFYKITWMFKGKEIAQSYHPKVTLVRHDDGTYTLKE